MKDKDWIIHFSKQAWEDYNEHIQRKEAFDDAIAKKVKAYADGNQDLAKYKKCMRITFSQRIKRIIDEIKYYMRESFRKITKTNARVDDTGD